MKFRINLLKNYTFKIFFLFALVFFLILNACRQNNSPSHQIQDSTATPKQLNKAEQIIENSIQAHGGEQYTHLEFEFDFRDYHYRYFQNGGLYRYERIFKDTLDQEIHDIMDNNSFVRKINGKDSPLSDEWKQRYSNSINSVMYFIMLPFKLRDPAVKAEYLSETQIKGQPYHEIKVTFAQKGGGKDYEDVFVYWFHRDKNTLDYFGYSYEVDEGGVRFREAINPQKIKGILFQDYVNYKAEKDQPVDALDSLFNAEKLEKLSEIVNENIKVN